MVITTAQIIESHCRQTKHAVASTGGKSVNGTLVDGS